MHFGLGTASAELLFHVNVMGAGQELPALVAADSRYVSAQVIRNNIQPL